MLLRSHLLCNFFSLSAYGISNRALEGVLNLFSMVLPKGHCVPDTMEKVQRVVGDLGLDYLKIDACEKNCVLFWKENANLDTCPKCGESRWKIPDNGAHMGDADGGAVTTNIKHVPRKILRYFPLTPCLQRLYMTAHHHKCDGIMKNWSMMGKCVTLLTRRHGSMWIESIDGLQMKLVILGWVLLLMASTPLACKILHTPYGMLS